MRNLNTSNFMQSIFASIWAKKTHMLIVGILSLGCALTLSDCLPLGRMLQDFSIVNSTSQDGSLFQSNHPSPAPNALVAAEEISSEDHEEDDRLHDGGAKGEVVDYRYSSLLEIGSGTSHFMRPIGQPRLFVLFHSWRSFLC